MVQRTIPWYSAHGSWPPHGKRADTAVGTQELSRAGRRDDGLAVIPALVQVHGEVMRHILGTSVDVAGRKQVAQVGRLVHEGIAEGIVVAAARPSRCADIGVT